MNGVSLLTKLINIIGKIEKKFQKRLSIDTSLDYAIWASSLKCIVSSSSTSIIQATLVGTPVPRRPATPQLSTASAPRHTTTHQRHCHHMHRPSAHAPTAHDTTSTRITTRPPPRPARPPIHDGTLRARYAASPAADTLSPTRE